MTSRRNCFRGSTRVSPAQRPSGVALWHDRVVCPAVELVLIPPGSPLKRSLFRLASHKSRIRGRFAFFGVAETLLIVGCRLPLGATNAGHGVAVQRNGDLFSEHLQGGAWFLVGFRFPCFGDEFSPDRDWVTFVEALGGVFGELAERCHRQPGRWCIDPLAVALGASVDSNSELGDGVAAAGETKGGSLAEVTAERDVDAHEGAFLCGIVLSASAMAPGGASVEAEDSRRPAGSRTVGGNRSPLL